jgi:hypothetical protein
MLHDVKITRGTHDDVVATLVAEINAHSTVKDYFHQRLRNRTNPTE